MDKYIEDEDYDVDHNFEDALSDLEYDEILGNETSDKEGEFNSIEDDNQDLPLFKDEEDEKEAKLKKRKSLLKKKLKDKPNDHNLYIADEETHIVDSDFAMGGFGYFCSDSYEAFGSSIKYQENVNPRNESKASDRSVRAVKSNEPKDRVSDIHKDIAGVSGIDGIEGSFNIEETALDKDKTEVAKKSNKCKSADDIKQIPSYKHTFLNYQTDMIARASILHGSETVDRAGNIIKDGMPLPHMPEIIDSKADKTGNYKQVLYANEPESPVKPMFAYSYHNSNALPQKEKVTLSVGEGVEKTDKPVKKIFKKGSAPIISPSDYYHLNREKAEKSGKAINNENPLLKANSQWEERIYEDKHIRKYKGRVRWKISVQTVGEVTKSTVLDELQDYDDNVKAGADTINRDIGGKLDYIGALGAKDLYAILKKRKNESAEAAISFKRVMGAHKIPMESLNDKDLLKNTLESLGKDEIDKRTKWIIIKYRKDIQSNLRIRMELLESVDRGLLILSSNQRNLIESGRIFDTKHTGVYESILKRSLTSHTDEYVRTIGKDIGRLKGKEIDKLINKAKENSVGTKVIRILEEYRKITKEKELKAGYRNSLSVVKIISHKVKYMNTGEGEGLRQIIRLKNIAGSLLGLTKASTVTGIKVVSKADHFIVGSIKPLKEADALWKSKKSEIKYSFIKKKKAAVGRAKAAIGNTKASKTLNVVKDNFKSSVKSRFDKVSKSKAGKMAKGVVKNGKKTIKTTGYVGGKILGFLSAPFRYIARGINLIQSGIRKIIVSVIIALGIVVIIYMGMLYIFSTIALLSDGVQDAVNALGSYINTEDMRPYLKHLNELDTIQYDEAKAIGEGTPKDPNVFYGHRIDHYGHPENTDGVNTQEASKGWKIHYQDAYGNPIANYSTNAKDLMCMAATMFGNYFEPDTALNSSFYELIDDLYELMNPDITWEESDIYTLAYMGEDTYNYKCNSDSDYNEMEEMQSEGVRFYGSVEEKSGGCYCPGHTTNHSDGSKSTEYCSGCKCNGHSVTVCYGHKDIDIYIIIYDKDYAYAGNIYPEGWENKSYAPYIKEFMDEGAWEVKGNCDYCDLLYGTDWYEYYGVDVEGGYGFTVGEPLTDADIEEILASFDGDLDETRRAICEFALSMVGRISYYWGGHASVQGFEGNDFGKTVTPDSKGRNKKGLDCSGFVSWVYWTVTGYKPPAYTGAITQNFNQISYAELKPGSIALLIPPGTENTKNGSYNHVGIYVGQDSNGNDMWVHCSGSSGVVCNNKTNWRLYYDLFD